MSKPLWFEIAHKYVGVKEVPGPGTHPLIASWLVNLKAWWTGDAVPWCGVFCAAVMKEAGLPYPKLYMRAKAWSDYGSLLRRDRLSPGAILVFARSGGGHVGFYAGEDDNYYYVLGGNQGNAVNISKIAKSRCIAARWPKGVSVIDGPVRMAGGQLSGGEA